MNELEKYRGLKFVQCRYSGFLQEDSKVTSWCMGEPNWEDYTYFDISGKRVQNFSYNDYLVYDKYPIEIINKEKLDKIQEYLEENPISYKEQLIEKVLTQIDSDLKSGDRTAIEQLLEKVEVKYLESYLPEESLSIELQIQVYQDWTFSIIGTPKTDGWYTIDNGDEVYLRDKFEELPKIVVTELDDKTITCPSRGYFLWTNDLKLK